MCQAPVLLAAREHGRLPAAGASVTLDVQLRRSGTDHAVLVHVGHALGQQPLELGYTRALTVAVAGINTLGRTGALRHAQRYPLSR